MLMLHGSGEKACLSDPGRGFADPDVNGVSPSVHRSPREEVMKPEARVIRIAFGPCPRFPAFEALEAHDNHDKAGFDWYLMVGDCLLN